MEVGDQHRHHRVGRLETWSLTRGELKGVEQSGGFVTGAERASTLPCVDERDCRGIDFKQLQASHAQSVCRRCAALTRH